jgi:hypothetical protein
MRCLEKKPSRRFQSCAEIGAATRRLVQSYRPEPDRSATPSPWLQPSYWLNRWRALSFRVRVTVVACLALAIGYAMLPPTGQDDFHTITLDVVNGRAEVYANGSHVGRTPYKTRARLGDSLEFELRRAGYLDQPVQFDVTERNTYSYAMQPAAPR